MKIEGYDIIKKLFSTEQGLTVYEVRKKGDNQPFILRLADYSTNKYGFTQDNWYEIFEQYQLTITNYKNLPRVSSISMLNESQVYSLVDYEEGKLLQEVGKLGTDEIIQLIAAIRHLHSKKFVHGAIFPENIWLTSKGKVILYGAGEFKALGLGENHRNSSDIKQLVEIIKGFSTLDEEDLEKLDIEKPTTIDEVESIIIHAKQTNPTEAERKKGGLVEKEEQMEPEKVVLTPTSIPEEKPSEETINPNPEDDEQDDERSEQKDEETPKNILSWVKKFAIGVVSVLALLFIIGLFTDSEKDDTVVPVEQTSTAKVEEEAKDVSAPEEVAQTSASQEAEEETVSYTRNEVENFMKEYSTLSIKAVNERDFSIVEQSLDPNGPAYKDQLDYIEYLESKNITEESLDFTVEDILKVDKSTFKVSTNEKYEISYEDGSIKVKSFNSSYVLKTLEDGRLVVNKLLYTQEVSSETIQEADEYYADEYYNEDISYSEDTSEYSEEAQLYSDDTLDDTGAIESAVRLHYGSISNDDFSTAYNQFSSSRKKKVSKEGWEKGLQENIYDELTVVEVEQVESNKGRAYIEMTSYDDNQDGTTLVQEWAGYWGLVKESGRWTLDNPDLSKVNSRVEVQ